MLNLDNTHLKLALIHRVDDKAYSYQVRAIATSQGEANILMNLNPNLALIAEDRTKDLLFLADLTPLND
jgi:hypothetical protein